MTDSASIPAIDSFNGSSILILDLGSSFTQLIARRIRECQVYSRIEPYNITAEKVEASGAKGIILSGSSATAQRDNNLKIDPAIFKLGIPILGICYGAELIVEHAGGKTNDSIHSEDRIGQLYANTHSTLLKGLPEKLDIWNGLDNVAVELPNGFSNIGHTKDNAVAAFENTAKNLYGVQFHPEVANTTHGKEIFQNFVTHICGCSADWTMTAFIEQICEAIRQQVGKEHVVLGLSGGVDSSVVAALLHRAIGDQLTCIFVNNGLLRAHEPEMVQRLFVENFHIKLKYVEASEQFLEKLKGVSDPEQKRKIIGKEFIVVFESAAQELKAENKDVHYRFLAQGTIYPDVIESQIAAGSSTPMVKSHHNVGGLPENLKFELVEPLRMLFKDEVRQVGLQLGLPKEVVFRQPFPGPALGVRVLEEITVDRLNILREADTIVVDEMRAADWYYRVWQSFAILLPVKSTGTKADARTYENTIVLRIVESQDGMTAEWVRIPYELLARISTRILNEVKGVNRVCYDISSKPPSTIEWE